MRLFLLVLAVLSVEQLEFAVAQDVEETIRLSALDIQKQAGVLELKHEPEFKYGDVKAYLSCNLISNATRYPIESVATWYKNETVLEENGRYTFMNNNTLVIDKPKRTDAGVYMAHHVYKTNPDIQHDCFVTYFARPLILDFPRSVNIEEGDVLNLRCDVKGYPVPVVTWFRNDMPLTAAKNSSHIRLSKWGGLDKAHLIIFNTKRVESGIFKCQAYSAHFNHTTSKQLLVRIKDKLAALWPLLGLLGSVILLGMIIASQEVNAKARIKKEEAKLYRESFIDLTAAYKQENN